MYYYSDLKKERKSDKQYIECPVLGCTHQISLSSCKNMEDMEQRLCKEHDVFLYSTTYVYQNVEDNLLWKSEDDIRLLENIFKHKAESRMNHDNSEDAVTWNVFRFLDKFKLLDGYLSNIIGDIITNSKVCYWSHSVDGNGVYASLQEARELFEPGKQQQSEPDLIIYTDKYLIFIEAKLLSSNVKVGKEKYGINDNYEFNDFYKSIFVNKEKFEKFELSRYWLLGNWMAKKQSKKFVLLNLVLEDSKQHKNIEEEMKVYFEQSFDNLFKRITWESIYRYLIEYSSKIEMVNELLRYFKEKSIYKKGQQLTRIFNCI